LYVKSESVVKPCPDAVAVPTKVGKNNASLLFETVATEDADEAGTACQDGIVPGPFDVKTKFVLPAGNLDKEVPVDATKISPML
jgi:hypothetical protein